MADDNILASFRLADGLAASRQHQQTATKVEALIVSDSAIKTLELKLADLALVCGRADLAVAAARSLLGTSPEHAHVRITHCFCESKAGEGDALRMAITGVVEMARAGLLLDVK